MPARQFVAERLASSAVAGGGASSGQQIVDDQHALAFRDGILVHLQALLPYSSS